MVQCLHIPLKTPLNVRAIDEMVVGLMQLLAVQRATSDDRLHAAAAAHNVR